MNSKLLSLKWNNHNTIFFDVLETLRKNELYSDVTIACDGKFFSVHKLVLATCSEYFQEMFERTPCKHPVIVLKDISHKILESLLNYMYMGEVNVIQTELASLIRAAECLQVKGLALPDEPPPSQKKSNKRPNANDKEDNLSSKRNRSESFSQNLLSSSSEDGRKKTYTSSPSSSDLHSNHTLKGSKETNSVLDNNQSEHWEFEPILIKTEEEDVNDDDYVENDLPLVSKLEFDSDYVEKESDINQRLDDGSESSFSSSHQKRQSADELIDDFMPSTSKFQEFETVLFEEEKEVMKTENYVENKYDSNSLKYEVHTNHNLENISESSFYNYQQQQQQLVNDSVGHLMASTSGLQRSSLIKSSMGGIEERGKDMKDGEICNHSSSGLVNTSQRKPRGFEFSLPIFSPALTEYLQGRAHPSKIVHCKKLFVSELTTYLNQNNLLTSKNKAEQSWGYRALENAILRTYPNIHVDEEVKASYKKKGPLSWVISHLADRRRKKFIRQETNALVSHKTSVDEAYRLLQIIPSKQWQPAQLKKALFITKNLRHAMRPEDTLPDYLLTDSVLCYEIGLKLGKDISALITSAKSMQRKLRKLNIFSTDELINYLSQGENKIISNSEMETYPGPYAELQDGVVIFHLPKGKTVSFSNCSTLRAIIVILGVYYLLDLSYPQDFGEVLGFFQCFLLNEALPEQYRTIKVNKLIDCLAGLKNV